MDSILRRHDHAIVVGTKPTTDWVELSLYLDHGATQADYDQISAFLASHDIEVVAQNPLRHHLAVRARVAKLFDLFGVTLAEFVDEESHHFFAPDREAILPAELQQVNAILGLDSAPQARPRFRPATSAATSYLPTQVAKAYEFPEVNAEGHSVALIELGGGFRPVDIETYFSQQGLPVPVVTAISVDGGSNAPTSANSADGEVMLDIDVLGSVAIGARIDVYFAPNTDRGFIDAVSEASAPTGPMPDAISISWGGPESTWSKSSLTLMQSVISEATARGITVTVAAGDNGSSDGLNDGLAHVDFPAAAPNALACGGTHLELTPQGQIAVQTVWNDLAIGDGASGGGISSFFPLPAYQANADVGPSANPGHGTGRGVPDVAGNADPQTGYQILVDGSHIVVGGTSAVAPLMAGLIVAISVTTGVRPGFVQPSWYPLEEASRTSATPAFFNVVQGSNGAYQAHPGWNACAGLGSPYGNRVDQSSP